LEKRYILCVYRDLNWGSCRLITVLTELPYLMVLGQTAPTWMPFALRHCGRQADGISGSLQPWDWHVWAPSEKFLNFPLTRLQLPPLEALQSLTINTGSVLRLNANSRHLDCRPLVTAVKQAPYQLTALCTLFVLTLFVTIYLSQSSE
jgi:hypothetical protein